MTGKVLEDSIRLGKIRRIKLALYIAQTAILVALAFVVAFIMGGATITPDLYLPIPVFVAVVVLLLLVICLESFFFRVLEIRFARSSSARHLMAKNSMRKAILIAAVSGIFAVTLLVPAIVEGIEDAADTNELLTSFETSMSFFCSDPLALMETGQLEVTADRIVSVYLVTEENYEANKDNLGALFSLRINKNDYIVPTDDSLTIDVPTNEYAEYVLVLDDWDNPGTSARVTLVKTLSPVFTEIVSLLLLAMAVGNVVWIAYLVPIERKYSAGSIYK